MQSGSLEVQSSAHPLKAGRGRVVLHDSGFLHPRSIWLPRETFTPYAELTHLQLSPYRLRIGTRRGVFWIRRREFTESGGPERLVRALLERIVAQSAGAAQLARMTEVEETLRSAPPPRVTLALVLACLAVFGLQLALGPIVAHAGHFSASLVAQGEAWRAITGNLLHGLPGDGALGGAHLMLNLLALLGLGALVELPLGSLRTGFIAGLSALGAMWAGWLVGYEYAVGASGIVAGMAGATLWLEFRLPDRLPAGWRVPRRLFVAVLVANALLPVVLPVVAGEAHLGGFLAGLAATALCAGPGLRRESAGFGLLFADVLLAGLIVVSVAGAAPLLVGRPAALARHAGRVLTLPDAPPMLMNNTAWLIAVAPHVSAEALARARSLAERAAEATERRDPTVLDTLAEAQFRSGDPGAALVTIEEAIALAPEEPYYREQRRRFTGEREFDDRPAAPEVPLRRTPVPRRDPVPDGEAEPGVRV